MGRAKEIELKVIPSKVAIPFVKKHHYSGKVVNNSCLHFGAFLDDRLHGVMSFGSPMDKRKVLGLVEGTGWNEMLELNRMAFDESLPRNSESRCISLAIKLIKRNAPQIKWILSFADGCSCGDGTIYRASNFVLTGIKENKEIIQLPDGSKVAKLALHNTANAPRKELHGKSFFDVSDGKYSIDGYLKATGGQLLGGYMFRYIYFIDKKYKDRLTVPVIPFSEIDNFHAGMYKGEKITQKERHEKITPLL